MEWLEYLVLMVNAKTDHKIEYRIKSSCGRYKLYLTYIDGVRYKTDNQPMAKVVFRKIIEEAIN